MKNDHTPTTDQPTNLKSKCRWFQYSLRELMIIVTLFDVACSWFAVKMGQAKKQREAVKAFKKLGGNIVYDYQFDASGEIIKEYMEPLEAPWLRKLLGDDFFHTVVYAHPTNDASMLILKDLSGIRQLNLGDNWDLELYSPVTDAWLVHLKGLPQLQKLDLTHTEVTDVGLEHLKALTNLQSLNLAFMKITDSGLECIKGLTKLKTLDLNQTEVTDAGLEHLKALTSLQSLHLECTKVTDAGLEHLKGLTQLKELDLFGTNVTDTGMEHLKGLTQLTKLCLYAKVTDEGVKKLQQALPKCKIEN